MAPPVLEVHSLTKRFGDFTAVNGISFALQPGEILGVLGPNGAGKTTTMHMLLGLITPTSGTISMFGMDLE
ncbi:MAG: ATP-binding cassette domain-containing protein, partial [Nitrospirota bacterium]